MKKRIETNSQCISESHRWFLGYNFWKGQYTSRNTEYINMTACFDEMQYKILSQFQDDTYSKSSVLGAIFAGIIDINDKTLNKWQHLIDDIKKANNYFVSMNSKFPYMHPLKNPMDILFDIASGKFCSEFAPTSEPLYRNTPVIPATRSWNNSRPVVTIDCNAELGLILSEVRRIFEIERESVEVDCESFSYDHFLATKKEIDQIKKELSENGSAYKTTGDESRGVGLLLYDYILENGCSIAEAVRWAKDELKEYGPKTIIGVEGRETQANRWLRKTRVCIGATEVLEI